jgi:hypothetical protein
MFAVFAALLAVQQQSPPAPPPASPAALAHDTGALRHTHGRTPPVTFAQRVIGPAPRIDGRLDDPAWGDAPPATSFTQVEPEDGAAPSESTEVRIVYDDEAIYVAARMYDSDPAGVRTELGRRDGFTNADGFMVAFDSYHDHRTTFAFAVNPSGVKSDEVTSNDQGFGDDGWDPVWEVATQRDSLGWTAEFRIPFSQLRYAPDPTQVWGVNFRRWIQRKAENVVFAWRPRTERGFASYFGHLMGLEGLRQPRRLELLPYATARQERVPPGTVDNPFNDGAVEAASAGLDLKYGLTSNLTVDATFNPDFGQVEADPAVVNLTAFETFFQERRPFFVEGAQIFEFAGGRFGGTQFFYSRRIGRRPQGFADSRGGYVDQPVSTTILGAAKLSGRTAGGWSLGLLEAITAREFAEVADSAGLRHHDEVEPLSNYLVLRAKRDYRGGASTLGYIATAVHRDLRDPNLRFLRRAAYAGGMDFSHRFLQNRYSVSGFFGWSHIRGDTLAIQGAQLSSSRYFQRPDADYVEYRPNRHMLSGWTARVSGGKDAGNWTFNASAGATSPGFELNDMGFQTSADDVNLSGSLNRRWTRPGRVFRQANLSASGGAVWNFGGDIGSRRLGVFGFGQFLNYWAVNGNLNVNFRALSDNLTRGGPLAVTPAQVNGFLGVGTDFRKRWQVFVGSYGARSEIGGWGYGTFVDFSLRPSTVVSLSLFPGYSASHSIQQYVQTTTDPTADATFGRRYVFADLRQRSLDVGLRLSVTVSPTLSFQLYAQGLSAVGDYFRYKELRAPRTTDFLVYGEEPGSTFEALAYNPDSTVSVYAADPDGPGPRPTDFVPNLDFAFRSLRSNAVVRWEYRPGSTLFLVWTTSCFAYEPNPRFSIGDDFRHLCGGPDEHVFAIKANYWLSF